MNKSPEEILQPILDLMSGVDGGIGYIRLRDYFLPELMAIKGDDRAIQLLEAFRIVSDVCKGLRK